ncbi:MAG TPA: low temperature requirement protein A [Actinomycetota bacterium]
MDRSTLRRLWHPPARFADRPADRRVTFLELFFDLVFVVIISQLAGRLAEHPTWPGVGWFVFLFYAVWSSWINGTLYYDLHGTNDVSVRVFTFAQMLAVAVMAVFAGDVPGEGATGFALGYAANTFILVILWFRTGLHDPNHRPASIPYSAAYLLAVVLFATSAAVGEPGRYWMWAAGLLAEVLGVIVAMNRWGRRAIQAGRAVIATTPSLIERMGLFIIIVLGEVIVGAVHGMAEIEHIEVGGIVIGMLGVLVAIGLWWLYFDLISHRPPVPRRTQLWQYLHLPLVVAMAAGGAGVLNTVEHADGAVPDGVRWLLVGSLAVAMFSIVLIARTLETRSAEPELRSAERVMLVAALLALGVGLTDWGAKVSLTAMALLLLAPVGAGTLAWLRRTEQTAAEHH